MTSSVAGFTHLVETKRESHEIETQCTYDVLDRLLGVYGGHKLVVDEQSSGDRDRLSGDGYRELQSVGSGHDLDVRRGQTTLVRVYNGVSVR